MESAFKGAPVRPRTKTYSSDAGFVYQYVYRGYLPIEGGREYQFSAKRAQGHQALISIRLLDCDFEECARRAERALLDAERYAIAKMALYEAFDEGKAEASQCLLELDAATMEKHLRTLGRIVD